MGVYGEKMATGGIAAGNDEIGANVALVTEEVLLEHGHDGRDAGFPAGAESVQLNAGGDEGGGEFGVCCCSGTGAPDMRGDVVELLAVLW